jgi:hypothetical protein
VRLGLGASELVIIAGVLALLGMLAWGMAGKGRKVD